MAPDCMAVRLHLRRMRVVRVAVDEPDRLEVVVADLRTVVRCPACGYRTTTVHETRPTRIFAFHKAGRISNGRMEGTNNKLGVLKRMAYGFTNAENFAARGLLLCPGSGP